MSKSSASRKSNKDGVLTTKGRKATMIEAYAKAVGPKRPTGKSSVKLLGG